MPNSFSPPTKKFQFRKFSCDVPIYSATIVAAILLYLLNLCTTIVVEAAEVPTAPKLMLIDGGLREWVRAGHLPVIPGGAQVSLRGAFTDDDHEADIYLMWDTGFLYVAALVKDDVVDVAQVPASERIWEGDGMRKDKMFFYDHFRIFVRDPNVPLGFDVWSSPIRDQVRPYMWGGRQRHPGSTQIPVQFGSMSAENVYTFELSIPWSWLEIFPQTDLKLEAMFLLTDADQPKMDMGEKVLLPTSHILWRGQIQLKGTPPGYKTPPVSAVDRIEEKIKKRKVPKIKRDVAISKSDSTEQKKTTDQVPEDMVIVVGDEFAMNQNAVDLSASGSMSATSETDPAANEHMEALTRLAAINRKLLAKRVVVPPTWLSDLAAEKGLSKAQRDSLFFGLTTFLHRLVKQKIDSRTHMLVIDMANYAGTRRDQARVFLLDFLRRLAKNVELPENPEHTRLLAEVRGMGLADESGVVLVSTLCTNAMEYFEANYFEQRKATTTDALLKKAARKSGMSFAQARSLSLIFLEEWLPP